MLGASAPVALIGGVSGDSFAGVAAPVVAGTDGGGTVPDGAPADAPAGVAGVVGEGGVIAAEPGVVPGAGDGVIEGASGAAEPVFGAGVVAEPVPSARSFLFPSCTARSACELPNFSSASAESWLAMNARTIDVEHEDDRRGSR